MQGINIPSIILTSNSVTALAPVVESKTNTPNRERHSRHIQPLGLQPSHMCVEYIVGDIKCW